MKIIIITMGRTSINQGKFYNLQDMGLAKALVKRGHSVELYNFVCGDKDEILYLSPELTVSYLHAKSIGIHTLHTFDFITEDANAVVCYSDNQLLYRNVVKQCKNKGVLLIPYVGVVGSHNRNKIVSIVLDLLIPNKRIYQTQHVLAKTPAVKSEMQSLGIPQVTIAPACLDLEAVQSNYNDVDRNEVREQLGVATDAKMILFIGRMIEEKRPEDMLTIFLMVREKMPDASLVMIGKGILLEKTMQLCKEYGLDHSCRIIPQISNEEIWRYYIAADVFVNLNKVEIFGMSLLEAMYYECPVVAWHAPGPDYIFTDGKTAYLCDSSEKIADRIVEILKERPKDLVLEAKQHVGMHFTWNSTAEIIEKVIWELKHE